MTVQSLNLVHRRYISISNRFKSAWTFHQFVQGLRKVFSIDSPEIRQSDFQDIYSTLKDASHHLNEASVEHVGQQLDRVEQRLGPMAAKLLESDRAISPNLLRQFFQRIKNYDDTILSQLVRFYLYFRPNGEWEVDRLDKADYLTTKLCEEYDEYSDRHLPRDPAHVREVAEAFWSAQGAEGLSETEVRTLVAEVEALRDRILATQSLDELHNEELMPQYRGLKHRLSSSYFEPRILRSIIEANLDVKNQVSKLYSRDEQRIIAEYQQVFELERDVQREGDLDDELTDFKRLVEQFEKRLQGDRGVRIAELAELGERVRTLLPKLMPEQEEETGPYVAPREVREALDDTGASGAARRPPAMRALAPELDFVENEYARVVSTLDDTGSTLEPKRVALQPEVFALGVSSREILAYRRLFSGAPCNRELEEVLLRGAALRLKIEDTVSEIKGILDETAVTKDSPIYRVARDTVRVADSYLHRFSHLIEQALMNRMGDEGRELMVLKMRLMRAYSGLWLMVHRR